MSSRCSCEDAKNHHMSAIFPSVSRLLIIYDRRQASSLNFAVSLLLNCPLFMMRLCGPPLCSSKTFRSNAQEQRPIVRFHAYSIAGVPYTSTTFYFAHAERDPCRGPGLGMLVPCHVATCIYSRYLLHFHQGLAECGNLLGHNKSTGNDLSAIEIDATCGSATLCPEPSTSFLRGETKNVSLHSHIRYVSRPRCRWGMISDDDQQPTTSMRAQVPGKRENMISPSIAGLNLLPD